MSFAFSRPARASSFKSHEESRSGDNFQTTWIERNPCCGSYTAASWNSVGLSGSDTGNIAFAPLRLRANVHRSFSFAGSCRPLATTREGSGKTMNVRSLTALLGLIAAVAAVRADPADREYNAWPFVVRYHDTLAPVASWTGAGPFLFQKPTADA